MDNYLNRHITQEVVGADPWDRVWQYYYRKAFKNGLCKVAIIAYQTSVYRLGKSLYK